MSDVDRILYNFLRRTQAGELGRIDLRNVHPLITDKDTSEVEAQCLPLVHRPLLIRAAVRSS